MRNVPDNADPNFDYKYHSNTCDCVLDGCKRADPIGTIIPELFEDTLIKMWDLTVENDREYGILFYREPEDYYSVLEGDWEKTDIVEGNSRSIEYPDLPSTDVTSPVFIHTHPPNMGERTRTFSPQDLAHYVPSGDRANGEYLSFSFRGNGILFGGTKPENVCDNVTPSDGVWLKMIERNWRASVNGITGACMLQKSVGRSFKHSEALNENRTTSRNRLMGVLDDNIVRTVTKVD